MDISKQSWSGILVQYSEQTKDNGIKIKYHAQSLINVEHFKALKRIGNTLTEESYAI